jgi:hypothetical protein
MSKTFGFLACFLIAMLMLTSGAFAVGDWIMEWYVLSPVRGTGNQTDALGIDWIEQAFGITEAQAAIRAMSPDVKGERVLPGEEGSVAYAGGTYTVKCGGADIWGTADAFRYTYKELSGDFTIALKAESIEHTNDWAKIGPMVRQSNAPGSQYTFMLARAVDGNKYFQLRADTDGGASGDSDQTDATGFPFWLKITRSGDDFTGATSPDGAAWTDVGTITLALADPVLVGLAVTSHSTGDITTAEATNLTIDGTEPDFGSMTSEDIGIQLTETLELSWSVQNLGDINDDRNMSNGFYGGQWGDMSNYTCYAMVGVYSPVDQDTILHLGQDDDAKVWINGELVIETIGWTQNQTKPYDVHLVGGKVNAMMVKVTEGGGGDYLMAQFEAENLEFSTQFATSVSPAGKLSVPWGSVKSLR